MILRGTTPRLVLDQQTYKEQDQELRSHADSVVKLPDTARALISTQPQDVLEVRLYLQLTTRLIADSFQWLSPADQTISYAFVLRVILQSNFDDSPEHEWLRVKIEEFGRTFDWIHIRFCGEQLRRIINRTLTSGLFPVC